MDALVVYESLFGNTHEVAEAIANGMREADPGLRVTLVPVAGATTERVGSAGLLVVGGPTHMRGMTSGLSRRKGLEAEQKAALSKGASFEPDADAEGPGLRDWFDGLPRARKGSHAAAFDTRAGARLAGGAARGIARRLRRHGYELVAEPEGFIIDDTQGPLREGEQDRARAWGAELARQPVH